VENLAAAAAPAPAPAASPANEALPLIDPHAKEHAFASVEIWHKAAMRAIGMLAHDPAALRAWADANVGTFKVVAARYPQTVPDVHMAIAEHLKDEILEQEPAE
jgi:hypothetical protein